MVQQQIGYSVVLNASWWVGAPGNLKNGSKVGCKHVSSEVCSRNPTKGLSLIGGVATRQYMDAMQ